MIQMTIIIAVNHYALANPGAHIFLYSSIPSNFYTNSQIFLLVGHQSISVYPWWLVRVNLPKLTEVEDQGVEDIPAGENLLLAQLSTQIHRCPSYLKVQVLHLTQVIISFLILFYRINDKDLKDEWMKNIWKKWNNYLQSL